MTVLASGGLSSEQLLVFWASLATLLGVALTRFMGWNLVAGAIFGVAVAVASTVVLLRVLADNDALHTPAGHVAVGWLLVEDLFTVLVLVMLPLLAVALAAVALTVSRREQIAYRRTA